MKAAGKVNRSSVLPLLGWAGGNPAVPLLGQCLSCLSKRHAGCFGDHSVNQRLSELPEPLRRALPVQEYPRGGQPQGRYQLLV